MIDSETDTTAFSIHPNEDDSQCEVESVEVGVVETEQTPTSTDQSNEGSSSTERAAPHSPSSGTKVSY